MCIIKQNKQKNTERGTTKKLLQVIVFMVHSVLILSRSQAAGAEGFFSSMTNNKIIWRFSFNGLSVIFSLSVLVLFFVICYKVYSAHFTKWETARIVCERANFSSDWIANRFWWPIHWKELNHPRIEHRKSWFINRRKIWNTRLLKYESENSENCNLQPLTFS